MSKSKLTKAVIIENLYNKISVDSDTIHTVIDCFFEEIKTGLEKDQVIELRGFGTFEVRERKGREKARNPKTGELVAVDKHGVAVFRPGKELKDQVWNLREDN
jgi:integration host factor subunit beta